FGAQTGDAAPRLERADGPPPFAGGTGVPAGDRHAAGAAATGRPVAAAPLPAAARPRPCAGRDSRPAARPEPDGAGRSGGAGAGLRGGERSSVRLRPAVLPGSAGAGVAADGARPVGPDPRGPAVARRS